MTPVVLSCVVACAVLCLGCLAGTVAVTAAAARPAVRRLVPAGPVRGLTVLFDPDCGHCRELSCWLAGQRQLVPLDLVPAASPAAWRRFPRLDHGASLAAITVVADGGQVYTGDAAWIACLWALAEYRPAAYRLAGAARQAGPWRDDRHSTRARSAWTSRPHRSRPGRPGTGSRPRPPAATSAKP